MTTIRRLAAILAADIAGYSRLMGEDEAGTAQALREHRSVADPLVAKHGGRVVKTTGDGVLIEFGSVVGAVECALALQQLAAERNAGLAGDRSMEWRIGVHLGDVLVHHREGHRRNLLGEWGKTGRMRRCRCLGLREGARARDSLGAVLRGGRANLPMSQIYWGALVKSKLPTSRRPRPNRTA
jgi:hypothetical protein